MRVLFVIDDKALVMASVFLQRAAEPFSRVRYGKRTDASARGRAP
jgi:hypothetical protein